MTGPGEPLVEEPRRVAGLITDRGFAARSSRLGEGLRPTLARLETADPTVVEDHGIEIGTWGLPAWNEHDPGVLLLASSVRRHESDLSPEAVRQLHHSDPSALAEVLPAFASVVSTPSGGLDVATDYLGFRHVFHGQGESAAIVSTSSRACAIELGTGIDLEAVAVQSLLGWQLGQRTMFEGVHKLGPGGMATLEDGRVSVSDTRTASHARVWEPDQAVEAAAAILRDYLAAYLDDHPDAGLQLTGGQDSRLLLSAIPKARRRGLRVVTLGLPGVPDVDIAAEFAAAFGMRHEILSLAGLEELSPEEAHALCLDAARRVEFTADPVAHAALTWAESRSEPGPRISGLGGEVARGFYYLGLPTDAPVTATRARRLARWRMFVNEAVPVEALEPSFVDWARDFATREVLRVLGETGHPWMAATDDLYLAHRMQRWGGVTETAVCLERDVVNPMLDERFISIATGLAPRAKRNSRFLSRLQLELDPELGSIPLDGRPPPAAYAHPSLQNSALLTGATMSKARRKVLQRARRQSRPPAGGEILAGKVVEYWRENPSTLGRIAALDVLRQDWLDNVVAGDQSPPASAVALLVNLIGATGGSA
jgi:asparagine synthase (glutamine-hydrolysing)